MTTPLADATATRSRTSSTYASTAVRPRTKRFLTGFEGFSEEQLGGGGHESEVVSPAPTGFESPFLLSRVPSPIPSKHPSRSSSLVPRISRSNTGGSDVGNELAASLSGLWGKSWTSLQGLASNVLGSDASTEVIKDNPRRSRRPTPTSSRPSTSAKHWGPSAPAPQTQPGGGSKQQRSAVIRAKKREELLTANGVSFMNNAASNYKRRTSDEFASSSAPPGNSDDRDTLIYVHHVTATDTLAGISIRYNCQLATIKRVNRMWSNDGVQTRKTLVIPVDACSIRGRKVAGPGDYQEDLLSGDPLGETQIVSTASESSHRRDSITTITPGKTNGITSRPARPNKPPDVHPWTHDSWTVLEGQTEPTQIARLPRQNLGYFPRGRRKSGSFSDFDRSSASLEIPRPSVAGSDTSSTRASIHRSRASSGSNQFAQQMQGPGGVGSLKGKGPSTPGPAEDNLTKVFRKQIPGALKLNGIPDEDFFNSSTSTPNFSELGHTVEGWAKKFTKGIAKALEPPTPQHVRQQRRAAGFSSTASGDLIELENAFEIGEEEDPDTPTLAHPERGRRGSFGGTNTARLAVKGRRAGTSRSRSHNGRNGYAKRD